MTTEFLAVPTDLPILPPIVAALFLLTTFLDVCVFALLLATDVLGLPILLAMLRLFDAATLLLRLTLIFVFRTALCCSRIPVFKLRTVDLVTVGVERLAEMLGRVVVRCVRMFVDVGVLVFTDLFVLPIPLFVLLIFICDCLAVLFDATLLLLTLDCLAALFDVTLLLLTLDCLVALFVVTLLLLTLDCLAT